MYSRFLDFQKKRSKHILELWLLNEHFSHRNWPVPDLLLRSINFLVCLMLWDNFVWLAQHCCLHVGVMFVVPQACYFKLQS